MKLRNLLLVVSFLSAARLSAQTAISWTNTAGGAWNVAANWSPNQVPTANNNVVITATGTYTVNVTTSAAATNVTLGASSGAQTLAVTSTGTLATYSGGTNVVNTNGVLIVGGALEGNCLINGELLWTNGTVGLNTDVLLIGTNGTMTINGTAGTDYYVVQFVTNAGTINVQSGNFAFNNCGSSSGVLYNGPSGTLYLEGDVNLDSSCNGGVVNYGSIIKSVGTGVSTINGLLNGNGTVNVETGTVKLNDGGTFNGAIAVAASSQLDFSNGTYSGSGMTVNGSSGSVLDIAGATINNAINFDGAGVLVNFTAGTATLNLASPLANLLVTNGTLTLGGTVTNLTLGGGTLGGSLTVAGTMLWTNGAIGVVGGPTMTIASNATLTLAGVNGTEYTTVQAISNAGTIYLNSGTLNLNNCSVDDGQLIIGPTGVLDFTTDVGVSENCNAQIANHGLVIKSGGTGVSAIGCGLANAGGVLNVQTGTISLASYTLAGGTINFGLTSAGSYGAVALAGSPATLGGTVSFNFNGGFLPALGNIFPVLSFTNSTGQFTNVAIPSGLLNVWQTNYGATNFSLSIVPIPTPRMHISANAQSVVALSWQTNALFFQLQESTNLLLTNGWTNYTGSLAVVGTNYVVTNNPSIPEAFYRLVSP